MATIVQQPPSIGGSRSRLRIVVDKSAREPALMSEVKTKAIKGGVFRLCGQAMNVALRLGSTIVLARLLEPKDFGLVAMVTAITGAYELFTSAGLSMATIQRSTISNDRFRRSFGSIR